MTAAVLLWDFGDTLVDERWIRQAPAAYPDWSNAWADVMDTYGDDFDLGRVSERDVLLAMSARTGLSFEVVERHADACCRTIKFHPFIWRVVTERRLPQALVTVNPDLFVNRVSDAIPPDGPIRDDRRVVLRRLR
jgi:hypothetical protein